jgi:hypothetical protein
MNGPTDLLDKFTQLLAYLGDEGAKDGYRNGTNNAGNPKYSVPIRSTPSPDLGNVVNSVKDFLMMPSDIVKKVYDFKAIFDNANQESKDELINYMNEYEAAPMRGGKRRTLKKRLTKKRRV